MVSALLKSAGRDSSEAFTLPWKGAQLEVPAALGAGRCGSRSTCCLSFGEHVDTLFRVWAINEAIHAGLDGHAGAREMRVDMHFASQASLCRHDVLTYAEVVRLEDLAPSSFEVLNTKLGNAVEPLSHTVRTVMRPQHLHASTTAGPAVHAHLAGTDIRQRAEDLLSKLLLVYGVDFETLGHLYDLEAGRQRYTSQIIELLIDEQRAVDAPPSSASGREPPREGRL